MIVYLAMPYRASTVNGIAENIARARETAVKLWQAGYTVICPHLNSAFMDGALPDTWFLNGDMEILRAVHASNGVIYFGEGWERSSGCREEKIEVEKMGMKILQEIK